MAAHLIWADYLQDPTGPEPVGIADRLSARPARPGGDDRQAARHRAALRLPRAAAGAAGDHRTHLAQPVRSGLSPVRRTLGAVLVAVAYLAASTLGIAGFKELLVGALPARLRPDPARDRRESRGPFRADRRARRAAGRRWSPPSASPASPGRRRPASGSSRSSDPASARGTDGRAGLGPRRAPGAADVGGLLRRAGRTQIPRIMDFLDAGIVGTVIGHRLEAALRPQPARRPLGRLAERRVPASAPAIGLDAWQLFGALGLIGFGYAALWWVRRRDLALPAALRGVAVVYLGTLVAAGRYVQAKALAGAGGADHGVDRRGAARHGGRRAGAGVSRSPSSSSPATRASSRCATPWSRPTTASRSSSALRDAGGGLVGPRPHQRPLHRLLPAGRGGLQPSEERRAAHRGSDGTRTSACRSTSTPPTPVTSTTSTTSSRPTPSIRASAPPELGGGHAHRLLRPLEAERDHAHVGVIAEESRPGRIFRCKRPKFGSCCAATASPSIWPRPVIAKRGLLGDRGDERISPGESGDAHPRPAPGASGISPSSTPARSRRSSSAPETSVVEMPPGVEGTVPFRPNEGPFWPVGEVVSRREPGRASRRGERALEPAEAARGGLSGRARQRGRDQARRSGDQDLQGLLPPLSGSLLRRRAGSAARARGSPVAATWTSSRPAEPHRRPADLGSAA